MSHLFKNQTSLVILRYKLFGVIYVGIGLHWLYHIFLIHQSRTKSVVSTSSGICFWITYHLMVVSSIMGLHCCCPWTDWKVNRCHLAFLDQLENIQSNKCEQLHWEALTQINLSWSSVFALMHNLQSLPQPSLLLNGDRTVWENCPCSSHFVWLWSHSTSCLCYSKLLCIWLDWRRRSLYLPSALHVQLHYNSFAVDSRKQSICC